QGRTGQQSGVDGGDGLGEARRGRGEVEPHGGGVDDLAEVVVVDRLGDGQRPVGVAGAVQVEVLDHVLGVDRGAVGVGGVLPQSEGVFGGVLVDLGQVGGDPRLQFQGLGVLEQQAVGDVVQHAAVGV